MGRLQVPPRSLNNITVISAGESQHEAPSSTDAAPAKPHPSKTSWHIPGWIFCGEDRENGPGDTWACHSSQLGTEKAGGKI